jgi:hypothetical protein
MMATMQDFGGLLFGGGGTGLEDYLSADQQSGIRNQALLQAAAALLQAGGPSRTPISLGQALGGALQAGSQGYQQAQQGAVQSLLMRQKLQEADRAAQMRKLYPQIFKETITPEQMTIAGIPARVVRDDEGNLMPNAQITPAQRQITIDPSKLQALTALSSDPLATLASVSKLVPDLRRAGFLTTGAQENPFAIFTQDATIPESIRRIATQYERSYASGTLDPEKADERIRQLGESVRNAQERQTSREQSASQFAQTAAGLEQSRNFAQQQAAALLALRQQAEANKPETFSYAQKKEFDTVQKTLAEAKSAEDSSFIADRAAPLISEAYTGKIEAGAKGLIGAMGISTTAKEANDRLTQLSQQLALKTPKFSGPTSDADAKRYDKAVGDLANPSVTPESKVQALQDIKKLAVKSADYAQQQENYYYSNNKSLKGFKYVPSNPFGN